MKRHALVLSLLLLPTSAVDADTYGPPSDIPGARPPTESLGAYACIVHRAVGFQGDRDKGERTAGRITLPDEQAHFTLTLKQRADGMAASRYCNEAKPHGPGRDYQPPKPGEYGMRYYSDLSYWFYCKATYELQLSPAKVRAAMRGDYPYKFRDHSGDANFKFSGGKNFVYTYDDSAGNFYMEEGECQKM
jgi:hypothetical protein